MGFAMSESRLRELRQKYRLEGGKYEPKPDCKFCNGTGERTVKATGELTFCICLFVAPEMSDFAGESLGAVARGMKDKIPEIADRAVKLMQALTKKK